MSNEQSQDPGRGPIPNFRLSRCGLWAVCDNLAMGRTDDHLVTITHGPMPEGEVRENMAAGRALLRQEIQELQPGNAFWLDVERVQPDGDTEPLGQAMVMPAAFLRLEPPEAGEPDAELQALLARYTPHAVLDLWRTTNAWYVLNPPEEDGKDQGNRQRA